MFRFLLCSQICELGFYPQKLRFHSTAIHFYLYKRKFVIKESNRMAAKSIVFPAEKGLLDGAIFVPINLLPWRSGCLRSTVANLLHKNFHVELQLFCLLFFLIPLSFFFFFFFFVIVILLFEEYLRTFKSPLLTVRLKIDYNQSKRL